MTERMVWSGMCDTCSTVVHLYPSDEVSEEVQTEISNEWPEAGDCYVEDCDGRVEWNGNDLLRDVLAPRML